MKEPSFPQAESTETRFKDLYKLLDFDEKLENQGLRVFREIKAITLSDMSASGSGHPIEVERMWHAFAVYCTTKLENSSNDESRIKLFQILKAAKLRTIDFFKEVPQFSLKAGNILRNLYNPDWETKLELKELKASVTQLYHLSRFYKQAYQEFFLASDTVNNSSASSTNTHYISQYHRFGWMIFLALRVHSLNRFRDLVTCTNELVSVLAVLIIHVPKCFRSFSIENSPTFAKKCDGVTLLSLLSHVYNTSEDDLRKTFETVNKLISNILKKKQLLASDWSTENLEGINTDRLTYFEDLLEDEYLKDNLVILEKDYEEAIRTKGELDERLFADDDNSSSGSASTTGASNNTSVARLGTSASPAKTVTSLCHRNSAASPGKLYIVNKPIMVSSTAVTSAMTTAKWFRTVISPLQSKPPQELEHFFKCCDANVSNVITRRAHIILEAIFPCDSFGEQCITGALKTTNLMDSEWAKERKYDAMKLYFRVLEKICKVQFKNNGKNLTSLLLNERFHRCMLACTAELVLATHNTVIMIFPAVLGRTGITAFDLSKVIEMFVRHEETLPRELKRHLNSLEERLLESMVWEKGSSLFNTLIIARPNLSAEIQRSRLLAEPLPSLDSIVIHQHISTSGLLPTPSRKREDQNGDVSSPKRICTGYKNMLAEHGSPMHLKECQSYLNTPKSKLHLQYAFASPARPNPAGCGTCAEMQITVFFSKIEKLFASRIKTLCERLKCPDKFLDKVYRLIQQILIRQTAIFFSRHIDQIILCSFYGVAKVSQSSLTFKEIINSYKKQPQCKSQVFQSVFINCRNGEYVDIITFYNEVFVPTVKSLLIEFGPHGFIQKSNRSLDGNHNSNVLGSSRLQPFPTLPDMSPKKVSASHNVYVSPLRPTKQKELLLSPSSNSYYACVGESTHAYQSPSKDLSAINNRLNCGRLGYNVVSDSVVAGSLGQQNVRSTFIKSEQSDS